MKVAIKDTSGADQGELKASFTPVDDEKGQQAVHEAVVAYNAAQRAGNASTKTVAEVAGTGAKPWRQKGTGRARAGTIRSPIWVGGGRAFAAKPRDYSQKVNRKMYRAAMCSVLSELVRQHRLVIVNKLKLEKPRTKELLSLFRELGLEQNVLIVLDSYKTKLCLAARNLPSVDVLDLREINPLSLIRYNTVLATTNAIKGLEERFA